MPWLTASVSRNVGLILGCLLWIQLLAVDVPGLSKALIEYLGETYGLAARERVLRWQELIASSHDETEPKRLQRVNAFFNQLRFVSDEMHWGRQDYWATPLEFLARNGGDCEDFSIAKYFTLLEMGVPQERMRITYVKALELGQAHMVLTYYPTPASEPLVLDNLTELIQPASERKDLRPVYSFNGKGLWLSVERGRGKRVGEAQRIGLWRELAERMQREMDGGRPSGNQVTQHFEPRERSDDP